MENEKMRCCTSCLEELIEEILSLTECEREELLTLWKNRNT